jgi:hypothetical protein
LVYAKFSEKEKQLDIFIASSKNIVLEWLGKKVI